MVREKALEAGLLEAVRVPYELAQEVNKLWPTLERLARVCNLGTASDLQVGARCLETSVWGAYHNVIINLSSLKDELKKVELQMEIDASVKVAQDGLLRVLEALRERQSK